jgi:hypothetical protein
MGAPRSFSLGIAARRWPLRFAALSSRNRCPHVPPTGFQRCSRAPRVAPPQEADDHQERLRLRVVRSGLLVRFSLSISRVSIGFQLSTGFRVVVHWLLMDLLPKAEQILTKTDQIPGEN